MANQSVDQTAHQTAHQSAFAILRHQRGYNRLFTAGLINGIGDRFSSVAMLAMVLQLTESGMAVGISLGVRVLPFLLLAPVGGMLGSRLSRKFIMITADLFRVPVALSLLWVDGVDKLWLLYTASFLLAAGEAVYSPVRKSSIALLVERGSLFAVNGLEQLMTGLYPDFWRVYWRAHIAVVRPRSVFSNECGFFSGGCPDHIRNSVSAAYGSARRCGNGERQACAIDGSGSADTGKGNADIRKRNTDTGKRNDDSRKRNTDIRKRIANNGEINTNTGRRNTYIGERRGFCFLEQNQNTGSGKPGSAGGAWL